MPTLFCLQLVLCFASNFVASSLPLFLFHCKAFQDEKKNHSSLATTVAAMVVDYIRSSVWRDWVRVVEGDRGGLEEGQLLEHGLVEGNSRAELRFEAFKERWCKGPSVADVEGVESSQAPTLAIHLSYTWPKPVPGFA